jgi:hypothetical protein
MKYWKRWASLECRVHREKKWKEKRRRRRNRENRENRGLKKTRNR